MIVKKYIKENFSVFFITTLIKIGQRYYLSDIFHSSLIDILTRYNNKHI